MNSHLPVTTAPWTPSLTHVDNSVYNFLGPWIHWEQVVNESRVPVDATRLSTASYGPHSQIHSFYPRPDVTVLQELC